MLKMWKHNSNTKGFKSPTFSIVFPVQWSASAFRLKCGARWSVSLSLIFAWTYNSTRWPSAAFSFLHGTIRGSADNHGVHCDHERSIELLRRSGSDNLLWKFLSRIWDRWKIRSMPRTGTCVCFTGRYVCCWTHNAAKVTCTRLCCERAQ